MKSFKLIISNIAEEELESIVHYTTVTFGEKQATIYIKKIFEAFYKLQIQADLGHSRSDLPKGFLCFNAEQHCIIYEIDNNKKRVSIMRILHSRMDFTQKF